MGQQQAGYRFYPGEVLQLSADGKRILFKRQTDEWKDSIRVVVANKNPVAWDKTGVLVHLKGWKNPQMFAVGFWRKASSIHGQQEKGYEESRKGRKENGQEDPEVGKESGEADGKSR